MLRKRHFLLAVLGGLVLYALDRTDRVGLTDISGESPVFSARSVSRSAPVTVEPLQERDIPAAARVLGSAFTTEPFTQFQFHDPVGQSEDTTTNEFGIRVLFESGQPVFTAKLDGDVVGVVLMTQPGVSLPPLRIVPQLVRSLPAFVRLLRRMNFSGAYHVGRAIQPPSDLPSPHYPLESMGVAPSAQGEAIGRVLTEAAHELVAADLNASGSYLVTGTDSTRDYFERFGYTTVDTKRSGDVVAYHMFRPSEQFRGDDQ